MWRVITRAKNCAINFIRPYACRIFRAVTKSRRHVVPLFRLMLKKFRISSMRENVFWNNPFVFLIRSQNRKIEFLSFFFFSPVAELYVRTSLLLLVNSWRAFDAINIPSSSTIETKFSSMRRCDLPFRVLFGGGIASRSLCKLCERETEGLRAGRVAAKLHESVIRRQFTTCEL